RRDPPRDRTGGPRPLPPRAGRGPKAHAPRRALAFARLRAGGAPHRGGRGRELLLRERGRHFGPPRAHRLPRGRSRRARHLPRPERRRAGVSAPARGAAGRRRRAPLRGARRPGGPPEGGGILSGARTVPCPLRERSRELPEVPAVEGDGVRITYRELDRL